MLKILLFHYWIAFRHSLYDPTWRFSNEKFTLVPDNSGWILHASLAWHLRLTLSFYQKQSSLLSLQPFYSLKNGNLLEYLTGTQRIRHHHHHSVQLYNFLWRIRNVHIQLMFSCSTLILPTRFWRILQPNQIRDGAMLNAGHEDWTELLPYF